MAPIAKTRWLAAALMLCMGAFAFPMASHAGGDGPDETPPLVSAALDGDTLRVAARDSQSGVKTVYVGGRRVTEGIDGLMAFDFVDYADDGGAVAIYAVDHAGNESEPITIAMPAPQGTPPPASAAKPWQAKGGEAIDGAELAQAATPAPSAKPRPALPSQAPKLGPTPTEGPGLGLGLDLGLLPGPAADTGNEPTPGPGLAGPAATESAVPIDPQPFTPDGTGTAIDHVESASKEFYAIKTEDENVFYLVIDHGRETNNVYFLNVVTEEDLLSLAAAATPLAATPMAATQSSIPDAGHGAIGATEELAATPEPGIGHGSDPGSMPEPEPSTKGSSNTGAIIFVAFAALALGGAGYYVKIVQPKKRKAQSGEGDEDEAYVADGKDFDDSFMEDEDFCADALTPDDDPCIDAVIEGEEE